jgi:hypothetical protein
MTAVQLLLKMTTEIFPTELKRVSLNMAALADGRKNHSFFKYGCISGR